MLEFRNIAVIWMLAMSAAYAQQKSPEPKIELKTYYTNSEMAVCGNAARELLFEEIRDAERKLTDKGCFLLPKNESVMWDEKITSGDAIVILREKKIRIRRAKLDDYKQQDMFNINFATSSSAFFCTSPFNLQEAVTASADAKWMKSLNCFNAPAGLAVIKIAPDTPSLTEAWQVRLKLPSGEGVTVWGMPYAFTLPNGERIR